MASSLSRTQRSGRYTIVSPFVDHCFFSVDQRKSVFLKRTAKGGESVETAFHPTRTGLTILTRLSDSLRG
jgi:hypothetical protein